MGLIPEENQISWHIVDPTTSRMWSQFVEDRPSTVFHSPQWMRVLEKTYGLSFSACLMEREGSLAGGVPWCDLNGLLGRRRVTLAFSDFCDLLAATPEEASDLAGAVLNDGVPWTLRTTAGNLPALEAPVARQGHFKWQGIDLEGDDHELWDRIRPMARRGVTKARRSGVGIRRATGKQELREWYRLHIRLRKFKHELLAQPYSFFEHIWDTFIENGEGFLLVAVHQGQIIGGTLYLLWKDTCYYKFNASDSNYLCLRPNNLLLWQGMMEAREEGCSLLDLGRSPTSPEGLIDFKRNFGAREDDLFSLNYGTQVGEDSEAQRLLRRLTQFFVRESVPDELSEEAAELLYQYFA